MSTIIFDLIGVITKEGMIATEIVYPHFKKSIDYQSFKKRYLLFCLGIINRDEFYENVMSPEESSKFEKELFEKLELNVLVCNLIKEISSDNKIILFSEIPKEWGHTILDMAGVKSHFDSIIISAEKNTTKPFKNFFNFLKEEVDDYEKALYVEDKLKNIEACSKFSPSIKSFHFKHKSEEELVHELKKSISKL